MSRNTLISRLLTPAGFATALALFLLPFLTFSCAAPTTPSEDFPFPTDFEMSATFTAADLILDGDPTIEVRQAGVVIPLDPSDIPGGSGEPAEEREPVPAKIRAPMIGSAVVLLLGVLLALIPSHAVRKLVAVPAALVTAGALAYVIYFAAPDLLDDPDTQLAPEDAAAGLVVGSAPAVGFWAIIAVLATVLLLQLIPVPTAGPPGPDGAPVRGDATGSPPGSPPPPLPPPMQ
jgi:hypothetical protein